MSKISENYIIAIIGVVSSLSVFIFTLIANKISYRNTLRYEVKRKVLECFYDIVLNNKKVFNSLIILMKRCIANYNEYYESKYDSPEKVKLIKENYCDFLKTYEEVKKRVEDMIFFMEKNIIVLHKYLDYYNEIKSLAYEFSELEELYYDLNIECSDEINVYEITEENVLEAYRENEYFVGVLNQICFYSYNLGVNLQNDLYSNIFNRYKLEEMKDYRYTNIVLKKRKNKNIDLYFGDSFLENEY